MTKFQKDIIAAFTITEEDKKKSAAIVAQGMPDFDKLQLEFPTLDTIGQQDAIFNLINVLKAFHHETITNLDQKNNDFQAQLDKKRKEIEQRAAKCNDTTSFKDEDERKKYLEESLAMFKADEAVYKAIADDVKLDPEQLKVENAKK